jgi:hypothetical protein
MRNRDTPKITKSISHPLLPVARDTEHTKKIDLIFLCDLRDLSERSERVRDRFQSRFS